MTPKLEVVPFRAWHYSWLVTTGKCTEGGSFQPSSAMLAQLEMQNTWTGVVDGDPIVVGGTIVQWPGRYLAWAYFLPGTLKLMPQITMAAERIFSSVTGRIEFTVRRDFRAGQRWARTLGFKVETPVLEAFGPEGEDHVGYVRFNKVA